MNERARRAKALIVLPMLVLLVLSACTDTEPKPVREADPASAPPPPPVSHVQVSAHPDDDFLFMNPDLAAGIRNGEHTAGIFLTGGESSMPNPARYAAQRQAGTRAAYAHMAGVADEWTRARIPVGDGRVAEVDSLTARPDVQLVFLNLPENKNAAAIGGEHALTRLWQDRTNRVAVNTLVPDGATVREPQSYDRSAVLRALGALFEHFRPTTIKLQDSQPDARYQEEWKGFHNHPDHVIGAKFARQAARDYMTRTGMPTTVLGYRDYNVAEAPPDLSATDRAAKRGHFASYARHDSEAGLGGAYEDWISSSYYRWPRGSQWAERDARGREHAFVVQGGRIAHWYRDPDGRWRRPEAMSTPGPVRPTLRVVRGHDGRLALFAQSWDGSRVLVKRQSASGDWPDRWQSLPGPHRSAPGADPTQVGIPSVAVDRQGRFVVVLKNANGGVSALRETRAGSNAWPADWRDLGGTDVQDGLSAVVGGDGRLHVFASTRDRLLRWSGSAPDGSLLPVASQVGAVRPAGPPRAVRAGDGRIRVTVRTAGGGGIATFDSAGSGDPSGPRMLPNPGGIATPAVVPRGDRNRSDVALVARDSDGNARVSHQRSDGSSEWLDAGGPVLDHPAALAEPDGRTTLLALGTNGELLTNPQDSGAESFGGWRPAMPRRADSPHQDGKQHSLPPK